MRLPPQQANTPARCCVCGRRYRRLWLNRSQSLRLLRRRPATVTCRRGRCSRSQCRIWRPRRRTYSPSSSTVWPSRWCNCRWPFRGHRRYTFCVVRTAILLRKWPTTSTIPISIFRTHVKSRSKLVCSQCNSSKFSSHLILSFVYSELITSSDPSSMQWRRSRSASKRPPQLFVFTYYS